MEHSPPSPGHNCNHRHSTVRREHWVPLNCRRFPRLWRAVYELFLVKEVKYAVFSLLLWRYVIFRCLPCDYKSCTFCLYCIMKTFKKKWLQVYILGCLFTRNTVYLFVNKTHATIHIDWNEGRKIRKTKTNISPKEKQKTKTHRIKNSR